MVWNVLILRLTIHDQNRIKQYNQEVVVSQEEIRSFSHFVPSITHPSIFRAICISLPLDALQSGAAVRPK